jgi:hypothetical protein
MLVIWVLINKVASVISQKTSIFKGEGWLKITNAFTEDKKKCVSGQQNAINKKPIYCS